MLISSHNLASFLKNSSIWERLHPWYPPQSSDPLGTSRFWNSPPLKLWAALSVLGRSVWVHACAWKSCRLLVWVSTLSPAILLCGHHDCFNRRLHPAAARKVKAGCLLPSLCTLLLSWLLHKLVPLLCHTLLAHPIHLLSSTSGIILVICPWLWLQFH